ncbi:hypothetical protein CAPTEDRAFT_193527 [Capitella teleta]|uniref:Uncharacterized protein n=1 Tax=Capitella teleta TaxID=283909 RepID=R7UE37_CAPTE|nr:hypothetical protein CAPTEDRAFT_193527 [Capitella teleta]|eukprot:ELU04356.1 hypothetical protein CAPTEDRAFT_193527 [Capitella teleta]
MEDKWPLTTSLSLATAEASAALPSLTERVHGSCTKLDSGASMHSEDSSQLRYAARSFKLHAAMNELLMESLAHIDTRVFALKEHLYQRLANRDKSCTVLDCNVTPVKDTTPLVRNIINEKINQFTLSLQEIDWASVYAHETCQEAYTVFHATFSALYNEHFPLQNKQSK